MILLLILTAGGINSQKNQELLTNLDYLKLQGPRKNLNDFLWKVINYYYITKLIN